MNVFADTSAIVKLYVEEAGSSDVRSWRQPFVVSELARVEVESALWGKRRLGYLSAEEARGLADEYAADWWEAEWSTRQFTVVALSASLLEAACALLARHDLRAADAVQLASALAARNADPGIDTFASFDARLSTAAAVEGFRSP